MQIGLTNLARQIILIAFLTPVSFAYILRRERRYRRPFSYTCSQSHRSTDVLFLPKCKRKNTTLVAKRCGGSLREFFGFLQNFLKTSVDFWDNIIFTYSYLPLKSIRLRCSSIFRAEGLSIFSRTERIRKKLNSSLSVCYPYLDSTFYCLAYNFLGISLKFVIALLNIYSSSILFFILPV